MNIFDIIDKSRKKDINFFKEREHLLDESLYDLYTFSARDDFIELFMICIQRDKNYMSSIITRNINEYLRLNYCNYNNNQDCKVIRFIIDVLKPLPNYNDCYKNILKNQKDKIYKRRNKLINNRIRKRCLFI
jgi:hypothetical protein